MAKNQYLSNAKMQKNDEFYTQLTDISKELIHYKQHFKDKIVFCNCDDPTRSAFWEYFHLNFEQLGLKKLISTHYDKTKPTYKMEYMGGDDNDIKVGIKTLLEGNGDFRSQECVEILKESDIVVTNPPFSLFREYVALLMEYRKSFVIIGNMNAIACKEIFPLIKDNKLWYGVSIHSGDREFGIPDFYEAHSASYREDENGNRFVRVTGVRWFTNLDHSQRHEPIDLVKKYSPEKYPRYDNIDAINVNKTKDIPVDYDGVMGVPITFLDKYNPDQFEIINGVGRYAIIENEYSNPIGTYGTDVNGKHNYFRILIRKKNLK